MQKKDVFNDFYELNDIISSGPFPIRFPNSELLDQDEEWCEVQIDGQWKKIRFHDYNQVYKIPGLYETLFYRTLQCNSPNRVSLFLDEVLKEQKIDPRSLKVLDFGAGNGMAAEALQNLGVRKIVGVDIIPEAKEASLRDRSWVYESYQVADFTKLDKKTENELKAHEFNTLLTVAALGFGDIPPLAFFNAYNLIQDQGLIAFNIRDEFLRLGQKSPFSNLITKMIEDEVIEIEFYRRYQHRINISGKPLFYVAIIATKKRDIPSEYLAQ